MMNISDYYEFKNKGVMTTAQVYAERLRPEEFSEDGLEDEYRLILGHYGSIEFPVVFRQGDGKYYRDMLDTGWPSFFVISEKMKSVLEDEALTGWRTYPVEVFDKKGHAVLGYHGFSITGRCGPIDFHKSEIIEKRTVPEGPLSKYYKGLFVGLHTWDGSDFFIPEGTYLLIVTEKAMRVMKEHKLTNVSFENLADIETWERSI